VVRLAREKKAQEPRRTQAAGGARQIETATWVNDLGTTVARESRDPVKTTGPRADGKRQVGRSARKRVGARERERHCEGRNPRSAAGTFGDESSGQAAESSGWVAEHRAKKSAAVHDPNRTRARERTSRVAHGCEVGDARHHGRERKTARTTFTEPEDRPGGPMNKNRPAERAMGSPENERRSGIVRMPATPDSADAAGER
jgi:hypothetical protein